MTTVTTLLYDTLHPTRVHQSQQILWESQLILVKDPKTSLCGTVTTEMSIYGDESMSCSKVHLLYSVTVLDKDKYLWKNKISFYMLDQECFGTSVEPNINLSVPVGLFISKALYHHSAAKMNK